MKKEDQCLTNSLHEYDFHFQESSNRLYIVVVYHFICSFSTTCPDICF